MFIIYLYLVTDAYSRKIVGWCLSDTLEAEYTLEALRMAIGQATALLQSEQKPSDLSASVPNRDGREMML